MGVHDGDEQKSCEKGWKWVNPKLGENPKMPCPQCGRSIKTYARGNNDAPSITKYGSLVRLDAQIVALRLHCAKGAPLRRITTPAPTQTINKCNAEGVWPMAYRLLFGSSFSFISCNTKNHINTTTSRPRTLIKQCIDINKHQQTPINSRSCPEYGNFQKQTHKHHLFSYGA